MRSIIKTKLVKSIFRKYNSISYYTYEREMLLHLREKL